jgi:hypothetical protein
MAAGAGFFAPALACIPVVAVAALLFRPRAPAPAASHVLVLRLGVGHQPGAALEEALGRHLAGWRLVGTTTARQGAALDLTYAVRLKQPEGALALVAELNRLEGAQGVELRQG